MKPSSLKQCTPVGSTPLSVQAIGVIRFKLGSYVDYQGQRHPLDLEILSVNSVHESTMNLLSTTHLKRYNGFRVESLQTPCLEVAHVITPVIHKHGYPPSPPPPASAGRPDA